MDDITVEAGSSRTTLYVFLDSLGTPVTCSRVFTRIGICLLFFFCYVAILHTGTLGCFERGDNMVMSIRNGFGTWDMNSELECHGHDLGFCLILVGMAK